MMPLRIKHLNKTKQKNLLKKKKVAGEGNTQLVLNYGHDWVQLGRSWVAAPTHGHMHDWMMT